MTSTVSIQKPPAQTVALWPQVDLLPKEVRAVRKLKATKRLLALALLALVLLAALGWVYALFALNAAKSELAEAEADTQRLTTEQATYVEVPRIKGQLADVQGALEQGTASEVLWKQYFEALRAVTPAAISYDSVAITVSTDSSASASADPLAGPSVGRIAFTGRSTTLPDMSAWLDAVRGVTGLADPWFTQASITDDDGSVYYETSATVQITDLALAHRFAVAAEQIADGATSPDEKTQTEDGA
jgi:hypothetical protein